MLPIRNPDIKYTSILINNQWVRSVKGTTIAIINPSTGDKITDAQEGREADMERAIEAARNAFKVTSAWRSMEAYKRGQLLHKLASLIERDLIYLAVSKV